MLTLGIRYLTGCVVASNVSDRRSVEWPPHPRRVFMALAAAHFQTGAEPEERAALEWLEAAGPPQIVASDILQRTSLPNFVPVNDEPFFDPFKGATKRSPKRPPPPLQSAPTVIRRRDKRFFAKAWLENDSIYLVWPEINPPTAELTKALVRLCGKVTRIGHSQSLVQMWLDPEGPKTPSRWVPDDSNPVHRLRVVSSGTLQYLERVFNWDSVEAYWQLRRVAEDHPDKRTQHEARRQIKERFRNDVPPRLWPDLALWQGYSPADTPAEPAPPGTWFDVRLVVLQIERVDGPYRHLDFVSTLRIATRLREAMMARAQDSGLEIPELLSGHQLSGKPSEGPHLALLTLPFVGHEHADARVMGLALAWPKGAGEAGRRLVLRALAQVQHLELGTLGRWRVSPVEAQAPTATLRAATWTGAPAGAKEWASVSPIALDRHSKAKDSTAHRVEMADSIREACRRVGMDVAVEVVVTPVSAHLGAPPAHAFPRLLRKDGSERRHTHAILVFDRPIVGPLVLGAGRYRGYGLCRPLA